MTTINARHLLEAAGAVCQKFCSLDIAIVTIDCLQAALDAELAQYSVPDRWLPWSGGRCPVPNGTLVEALLRNGDLCRYRGELLGWHHYNRPDDVLFYRELNSPTQTACAPPLPMISFGGGLRPVPLDSWVRIQFRSGATVERPARDVCWAHCGCGADIVAYRRIAAPQTDGGTCRHGKCNL